MISFLKNWVEQIVVAVIIVSIFELILPKGNLKKYIKVVLGIYVVFCMISPFVKNKSLYNLNLEDYLENTPQVQETSVNQTSMDKRLEKLYVEELEKDVKKKVQENGYEVSKCDIDADLRTSSDNPGIHKIDLIIYEKNKIEDVKINVGTENNETQNDEKIENLKQVLANNYEIEKETIKIKFKK